MKSTTDGERYVTQSVHTSGGIQKTTTTGVDNKTINSKEVIGGINLFPNLLFSQIKPS